MVKTTVTPLSIAAKSIWKSTITTVTAILCGSRAHNTEHNYKEYKSYSELCDSEWTLYKEFGVNNYFPLPLPFFLQPPLKLKYPGRQLHIPAEHPVFLRAAQSALDEQPQKTSTAVQEAPAWTREKKHQ